MKWFCLFAFSIVMTSCFNAGEEEVRTIDLSSFSVIHSKSVFKIILKQSALSSINIMGDAAEIQNIECMVKNDTLVLQDLNKGKWLRPQSNHITLLISSPDLYSIVADESYALSNIDTLTYGTLSITNFPRVKISDISLQLNGTYFAYWNNWLSGGNLVLSGKATAAELWNFALHQINAENLKSEIVTIHNFGKLDCKVNATVQLDYSLDGPGNIILYGDPPHINLLESTSTGKLIKVE